MLALSDLTTALLAATLLLAGPGGAPDLETPQASLESFLSACDRGDYARAALSLDLGPIDPSRRAEEGPQLARMLKAVMDEQVWFRWSDVPDRPDGTPDGEAHAGPGGGAAAAGPREDILLYSLFIGDRDYEVRLRRIRQADGPPVWAFSRQTVEHIPALFRAFGPSRLELSLPLYLRTTRFLKVALWQWIGFAIFLSAGGLLGWLVQKGIVATLRREGPIWLRASADSFRGPGALAVGLWSYYLLAHTFLGLARPILSVLEPLYIAVAVGALVWFFQRLLGKLSEVICRRYESYNSDEGNVLLTRFTVARHLLAVALVVGGAAIALGRFEWFRQVGVTLLASAGVAGLVLGVAARVLGNLFAGLLLAITQPVKTGDAIHFEGDFGWIEEVALTYLVIRSWDLRRIVVPITYFLDKPFQNWSRRSQQLMLPVYVQADPRLEVGLLRDELKAILESSPDWDRSVPPILQVTGLKDGTLELRALCSAGDPTSSWNLQCLVRERLVAFLRDHEGGRFLPRSRVALVDEPRVEPASNAEARNGRGHAD